MRLTPKEIENLCMRNYNDWKEAAFYASTKDELNVALEKTFFWLELKSSLLMLWALENLHKDNPHMKAKIMEAQYNLNAKIVGYMQKVIRELEGNG